MYLGDPLRPSLALPVYVLVGSCLIVVNERLLHRHAFAASDIAAMVGLASMMLAAAWSDWQDRVHVRVTDSDRQ
ncbi:MAG: hypothetical protein JWP14_2064 [Frankiales bacterium]|nr:hypothetical protein [Frankiales bacterium]